MTDYNTWLNNETATFKKALERAFDFACERLSTVKFENRKYKKSELLVLVRGEISLPEGLTATKWHTIQDAHRAREENEYVNVYTGKNVDSVPKGFVKNGSFCGKDQEIVDWCAANIGDAAAETEMEVSPATKSHDAPAESETIEVAKNDGEESDDPVVRRINKEMENSESDEDKPLARKTVVVSDDEDDLPVKGKKQPPKKAAKDSDDEDDLPVKGKKPAPKKGKDSDDDEDDLPVKGKKPAPKKGKEDSDEDDLPVKGKKPAPKKGKDSDDEADDEDEASEKPKGKKPAPKKDSDDEADDEDEASEKPKGKKPAPKKGKKDSDDEADDDDEPALKYPKGYTADKFKKLKAAIAKAGKNDFVNVDSNRAIKETDANKKKYVFVKGKKVCVPKENKVLLEWIKKTL